MNAPVSASSSRLAGVCVLMWVACVASEARAQCPEPCTRNGTLIGAVASDWTQQPLPDVEVTATAPTLRGKVVVRTDGEGKYRIPDLPPGLYTLRFEEGDHLSFTRGDVPLRSGRTLRVNVGLIHEDSVFVTLEGQPPLVATYSTGALVELDPESTALLPVNLPEPGDSAVRSFDLLAKTVPGARWDAYGPAIQGATTSENRYLVDGLATNDSASGLDALPLSVEFLEDLRVLTSGLQPEYGRTTGGILEAQVRSERSGQLRGSVFGYWVPGVLAGRDSTGDTLQNLGDFGATLGGPLVEQRLYFFAGVAPALGRVARTRGSRTFFDDQRTVQAVAKLTYVLAPGHDVALTFITTPAFSREVGEEAEGPRELDSNVSSARLAYAGEFLDRRLRLDTRAGWQWQRGAVGQGDAEGELAQDRLQSNAQLTYMWRAWGLHFVRAGVDAELLTAGRSPKASLQVLGGHVQDRWEFQDRFTLNAGLRYDVQWLKAADGGPASRLGGSLSPRLGLAVDPWPNGRTRIFAHVARYEGLVPPGLLMHPAGSVTFDPDLAPPSTRELVVGVESEPLTGLRALATYTRRTLGTAVRFLPRDEEGTGVLLGNPGVGLDAAAPEAEHTYDAVTLMLERIFGERGMMGRRWMARFAYTWSRLHGNTPGLVPLPSGADLEAGVSDAHALLPTDRTHTLRAHAAREFHVNRKLHTNVGLSYLGASGTPLEEGGRTPWVHTLDAHLGVSYALNRTSRVEARLHRKSRVEVSLDVFNVLDAREDTALEGRPRLRFLAPRQVRLGARYQF
jgi:hypothetical protein